MRLAAMVGACFEIIFAGTAAKMHNNSRKSSIIECAYRALNIGRFVRTCKSVKEYNNGCSVSVVCYFMPVGFYEITITEPKSLHFKIKWRKLSKKRGIDGLNMSVF